MELELRNLSEPGDQISGRCPKPPRSFIGRAPSLSGCWGKIVGRSGPPTQPLCGDPSVERKHRLAPKNRKQTSLSNPHKKLCSKIIPNCPGEPLLWPPWFRFPSAVGSNPPGRNEWSKKAAHGLSRLLKTLQKHCTQKVSVANPQIGPWPGQPHPCFFQSSFRPAVLQLLEAAVEAPPSLAEER